MAKKRKPLPPYEQNIPKAQLPPPGFDPDMKVGTRGGSQRSSPPWRSSGVRSWRPSRRTSTPFDGTLCQFEGPRGGRIAVKVINHLSDEVMKVFRVA